jgi:hypothetical protein
MYNGKDILPRNTQIDRTVPLTRIVDRNRIRPGKTIATQQRSYSARHPLGEKLRNPTTKAKVIRIVKIFAFRFER